MWRLKPVTTDWSCRSGVITQLRLLTSVTVPNNKDKLSLTNASLNFYKRSYRRSSSKFDENCFIKTILGFLFPHKVNRNSQNTNWTGESICVYTKAAKKSHFQCVSTKQQELQELWTSKNTDWYNTVSLLFTEGDWVSRTSAPSCFRVLDSDVTSCLKQQPLSLAGSELPRDSLIVPSEGQLVQADTGTTGSVSSVWSMFTLTPVKLERNLSLTLVSMCVGVWSKYRMVFIWRWTT